MTHDLFLQLLSLGASISIAERNDAGDLTTRLHQAEVIAQRYLKLDHEGFFIRPGLRLGYEYTPYPDDPQSVRIEEKTWNGTFELGILYEGFLIPSMTWQNSLLLRQLQLTTQGNLSSESSGLPAREWLSSQGVAFGLGIPLDAGRLVVEPFYRIVWLKGDERLTGQWGIDTTWALSWGEKSPENAPN
ncbi:MAG: hypothetical protein RI932_1340 [Pseudomonadota bacterium]